ncbi:heterogeneous nuclear ribonucleoprotein D-like isoform X1 [Bolinopsis microptera]|uniref:heterogeneous nuclear ribonucleoprotein D-like isoform X1 n=1 Tax=Bolinopsis microptera TaxID=2820187 RepID=UPI00307ADA1A
MSEHEEENGNVEGLEGHNETLVDRPPTNWVDYAEDRKIYVSSLNFATRDGSLKAYFEKYGEVEKAEVKMESATRSRGFGFVVFMEPEVLDTILEQKHSLDGREIEVKRAITMKEKFSTNKLFVGGLPPKLPNEDVVDFFKSFGEVQDVEWVVDRVTGNRKGFCFVIFTDPGSVEEVTDGKIPPQSQKHEIKGYTVECKKKFPDNHPVQKKIKRIQQQKKERAMAHDYMGQDYMAYGYDYYNGQYYDGQYFGYGYPSYGYSYPGNGNYPESRYVATPNKTSYAQTPYRISPSVSN